jgi:hypothetical protein
VYTGRKRLMSRKEMIRIDQKGQSILPRNRLEIKKTTMKYLTRVWLGLPEGGTALVSVFSEAISGERKKGKWITVAMSERAELS